LGEPLKLKNLLSNNYLSSRLVRIPGGSKMQEVSCVTIWNQEDLEDEYDMWVFEPLIEEVPKESFILKQI
jgi:hypothetical protein